MEPSETTVPADYQVAINNVCENLVEAGTPVAQITNNKIRETLGGGSYSRIGPALRAWKEKQRAKTALAAQDVPEEVTDVVDDVARQIWKAAESLASRRVLEISDLLDAKEAELKTSVKSYETEIAALEAEISSLKAEKDLGTIKANEEIEAARTAEKSAQNERVLMAERLTQAQADTENLRSSLAVQQKAANTAEKEKSIAEAKLELTEEDLEKLRKKNNEYKTKLATSSSQLHEASTKVAILEAEKTQLQRDMTQLKSQLKESEDDQINRIAKLTEQMETIQKNMEQPLETFPGQKSLFDDQSYG